MNRIENVGSPDKDQEFDWDPSQSTVTAWSATNARKGGQRRAYGRRASKKSGDNSNKRRSLHRTTRRQAIHEKEDDEWGSASSSSSFDLNNRTDAAFAGVPLPLPRPLGSHTRSKSFTATSTSSLLQTMQRPPLLRQRSNASSSFSSSTATLSSSSNTIDSRFEQSENAQPNILTQDDLSVFPSPQPPTKLKKIDVTPSKSSDGRSRRKKLRQRLSETDLSDSSPASFVSPSSNHNSFSRLAELAPSWIKPPDLSFGCLTDANVSSPAQSVATTGSRKRGVCELPSDEEEESVNAGYSFMSGSSYETRSRSRSRIFSNGSAIKGVTDAPEPSDLFARAESDCDHGESDLDSGEESHADEDSVGRAMDVDLEDNPSRTEDANGLSLLPPKPVRRSSNGDFADSVFGTKNTADDSLSPSKIFETMSNYNDLKFLIKALRKEKVGSTKASFGTTKTWAVAPPAAWDSGRRAAFLQWANRGLGFSLRSGGGAITFLQTSVSKGCVILERLEAALVAHKANTQNDPPPRNNEKKPFAPVPSDPIRQSLRFSDVSMAAVEGPSLDGDVDMDLLSGMESLSVNEKKEVKAPDNVSPTAGSGATITRHVTLEESKTSRVSYPHEMECLPVIWDDVESPHESNRLSEEHHAAGHDLVSHLYGLSPMPGNAPPALSRPRLPRTSTSPYLPSLPTRPSGPRTSNIPFDEDESIETPLIKRDNQFWGSGSRGGGRDWGASAKCSEEVILELLNRLEQDFKLAGCPAASPFDSVEQQMTSASCFLPPSVASAAVSSSALGFDDDIEQCDDSDITDSENEDTFDVEPGPTRRRSSVGESALAELNLDETNEQAKMQRKRMRSFAKHRRVSICAEVLPPVAALASRRQTVFGTHAAAAPTRRRDFRSLSISETHQFPPQPPAEPVECPIDTVCRDEDILSRLFSYLSEQELLCNASPVSTKWADAVTVSHANLMLISVGCSTSEAEDDADDCDSDDETQEVEDKLVRSVSKSMERTWKFLVEHFPWACYLSDGAFKRVYKVHNGALNSSEALSVMDIKCLKSSGEKSAVGAELAVSAMLSSLARRNICPNFVITRGVFTCPYEPPKKYWGSAKDKRPRGGSFDSNLTPKRPRQPGQKKRGKFQYIRMELCRHGDAEEYLKRLPKQVMPRNEARVILFQIAFALHVAANRFSLKHYDMKLLNIFLQDAIPGRAVTNDSEEVVLRYGLGAHVFALRVPAVRALLAKVADYGTANVQACSNGQPVTIAQFTTHENTPPDYLLRGDAATQGHGHDCFGLGLCMLHLFTGHRPYEEILENVHCPPTLKKKLRAIWQEDEYSGYSVVRQLILADVDEEEGVGEPDEILYHTLYRFLVLFGIPEDRSQFKEYPKVAQAITQSLEGAERSRTTRGRKQARTRNEGPDSVQFARDRRKYSLSHGSNKYIKRARQSLEIMEGGMDLLKSLVDFNPKTRATPLDVMNSSFMASLREEPNQPVPTGDNVLSFMSYATR